MKNNMNRKTIKISPSMMCADMLHLENELDLFAETGIDYLHMDIMDGHYVPNFTLGPGFCKMLAENSPIPLDIHLMIENVDKFIPVFSEAALAGRERFPDKETKTAGTIITFHPEAEYHPIRQLHLIKSFGIRGGLALDPATPLETLKYLLPHADMLLLMTVNPGYSGQKLVPGMIEKIAEIDEYCRKEKLSVEIEVDGNVSWENIPKMIAAGAETLVAGTSSLFDKNMDRRSASRKLRSLISGSSATTV